MYKKTAVILAGGKGTRLRPYTWVLPKPLMPIGDMPILDIIIKQLVNSGFNEIILAVNHQAELIKAYFGDGNKYNVEIRYSVEEKPLSTMGPLKLISDLPENFLIMNGDILTDLNFANLFEWHISNNSIFTISSYEREHVNDYGVLSKNENDYLNGFFEKPKTKFEVSMGIYVASNRILDIIPEGQFYGFDHLMHDLISKNDPAKVKKHIGYWLDIGRPDDYHIAIDKFENERHLFLSK
jgi:NDP-sugar pyrophosphorylase family protein